MENELNQIEQKRELLSSLKGKRCIFKLVNAEHLQDFNTMNEYSVVEVAKTAPLVRIIKCTDTVPRWIDLDGIEFIEELPPEDYSCYPKPPTPPPLRREKAHI